MGARSRLIVSRPRHRRIRRHADLGLGGMADSRAMLESAMRERNITWIANARVTRVEYGTMHVCDHDEAGIGQPGLLGIGAHLHHRVSDIARLESASRFHHERSLGAVGAPDDGDEVGAMPSPRLGPCRQCPTVG